jgi:hypothetical protein
MFRSDYDEFAKLIDETYSLISAGKSVLPAGAKAMFFRSLERFPIEAVRSAINAHVCDSSRGQYLPKPADLIFQIEQAHGGDGRPGADEAWALALAAGDEAETVVWTEEMRDAFGICQSVLALGDEVGARVAFRDAYNRMVDQARQEVRPAKWCVSLGWDMAKREAAVMRASRAGLLPAPAARAMLPNYVDPGDDKPVSPEGLAKVKELMAQLRAGGEAAAQRRAAEAQARRDEETARKNEIAAKVSSYEKQSKGVA